MSVAGEESGMEFIFVEGVEGVDEIWGIWSRGGGPWRGRWC